MAINPSHQDANPVISSISVASATTSSVELSLLPRSLAASPGDFSNGPGLVTSVSRLSISPVDQK